MSVTTRRAIEKIRREQSRRAQERLDQQISSVSELSARYLLGWKPKRVGKRRFPRLEKEIRAALQPKPEPPSE